MAKKPGKLILLDDKRTVIVYDEQPLLKDKGKLVMYLVDSKHNLLRDFTGKPKTVLKTFTEYKEALSSGKMSIVGYKVIKNCGGLRASFEIAQDLKNNNIKL